MHDAIKITIFWNSAHKEPGGNTSTHIFLRWSLESIGVPIESVIFFNCRTVRSDKNGKLHDWSKKLIYNVQGYQVKMGKYLRENRFNRK